MTTRKILLINNQAEEVELIQKTLDQSGIPHSLSLAKNASEALYILMGSSITASENYFRSRKIRPHAILLAQDLPDMNGLELLGIIRKYYSLKNIKVFLLTRPGADIDPAIQEQLAITACLTISPGAEEPVSGFERLKSELDTDETSRTFLTLIPLAGNTRRKSLAVKSNLLNMGTTSLSKAAIGAAFLLAIGSTVNYRTREVPDPVPHTAVTASTAPANPEPVQEKPIARSEPVRAKTSEKQAGSIAVQSHPSTAIIQNKDSLPQSTSSDKRPRPVNIKALPEEEGFNQF
jgi:CheY-like chemotaxis protein